MFKKWDIVSTPNTLYPIPWRCVKILLIFANPGKKKWLIRESVAPRTQSVSCKEPDYIKSQEEARFKGNSSNICALVMKGVRGCFHQQHMWPVGKEGWGPGKGVSVITDGLSMGKKMPESPRQSMLFWGLSMNPFFILCQCWRRQVYLLIGYWRFADDQRKSYLWGHHTQGGFSF